MRDEKEFYKKLKESLLETTEFPTKYMFKFIVDTSAFKLKEIEDVFDNMGAVISTRPSKTGKYTSVTVVVDMETADHIIDKYKEVSKVEGIISL